MVADMQGDPQPFDLAELSRRIQAARDDRGLSMAALSDAVGVSESTIRRFATADDAEADGVLALLAWLGDPPEAFLANPTVRGVPLRSASGGQMRVDLNRVAEATGQFPSKGVTRTTIQRVAHAAQQSGWTIAALTRWTASEIDGC